MSAAGREELLARHRIANLLHTLVASVDAKDVGTVVDLVGTARVEVRGRRGTERRGARSWLTQLWTDPGEYRHDLSMLAVTPAPEAGRWTARANYTRWSLGGIPAVHTLGEYDVLVDTARGADAWCLRALTVTRTWTRGG